MREGQGAYPAVGSWRSSAVAGSEGEDRFVLRYGFVNRQQPKIPVTLQRADGQQVTREFRREDAIAVSGIGTIPPGYVILARPNASAAGSMTIIYAIRWCSARRSSPSSSSEWRQ